MVKYETILKIIKTHYSLKEIGKQISPVIKQISDNQKEYNDLMRMIPRFYRDYWNKDTEFLQCITYDGETFVNDGTNNQVDITDDMKKHKGEYLLTIHNHPDGCCFQSDGDIISQSKDTLEKYRITIGKDDGIMITKNTDFSKTNQWAGMGLKYTYQNIEDKIFKTKEYKELYNDYINKKYPFNNQDRNKNYELYDNLYQKMIIKEISKDPQGTITYLNNQFQELDKMAYPISYESTFIPIDKKGGK